MHASENLFCRFVTQRIGKCACYWICCKYSTFASVLETRPIHMSIHKCITTQVSRKVCIYANMCGYVRACVCVCIMCPLAIPLYVNFLLNFQLIAGRLHLPLQSYRTNNQHPIIQLATTKTATTTTTPATRNHSFCHGNKQLSRINLWQRCNDGALALVSQHESYRK